MIHHFPAFGHLREFLASQLAGRRAFLLTDSNCLEHCWPELIDPLGDIEIMEVEPGESSKDLDIVNGLWHSLLELHADRSCVLISLGGGVVTDLGGFIASTYKRGIAAIHIPTSLLGMVDAAVGGKTGINLGHAKNQVGTFYQAEAVCICPAFLQSLPANQLTSGYAEMLKHALLEGSAALEALTSATRDAKGIAPLVAASAQFKQAIVDQDERESGLRKHLNLGHTVGHGIESVLLDAGTPISHGHAVAWGLVSEADLGVDLGVVNASTRDRILQEVSGAFNPIQLSDKQMDACIEVMLHDKKNSGTEMRLVLVREPGEAVRDVVASPEQVKAALQVRFSG